MSFSKVSGWNSGPRTGSEARGTIELRAVKFWSKTHGDIPRNKEKTEKNTLLLLLLIINHKVYDVSHFLSIHPGGASIILTVGGSDATEYFDELHRPEVLQEVGDDYIIGEVICAKL